MGIRMKTLRNFIKWFLYITVGILIVCGISYRMAGNETVTVDVFWMILLSAFVTTLVTVLILPKEEDGKVKSGIKFGLHYMVLCVIMCFLGEQFGWINSGLAGIAGMIIRVGIVYLLAFMAYYIIDIKQASDINKMLQEKYGEEEKITLCGDNCIECPRYNAHSEEELQKVAELWHRVGWRDSIVSNEEIRCEGCSSHKQCTYHLVECTKEHNVDKCNQCAEFPCGKISSMLERSKEYQKRCKEVCSDAEYDMLEKAFFDKENNLKK